MVHASKGARRHDGAVYGEYRNEFSDWAVAQVCDRAWVDVCSRYGWYHMHEKLVQGVVATYYGKLLVQWGVSSCSHEVGST